MDDLLDYMNSTSTLELPVPEASLLDRRIADKLWKNYWLRGKRRLVCGFGSYDELLAEVVKQKLKSGIHWYIACRFQIDEPFKVGNLRFVAVRSETDLADVSLPAYRVTEEPDFEMLQTDHELEGGINE